MSWIFMKIFIGTVVTLRLLTSPCSLHYSFFHPDCFSNTFLSLYCTSCFLVWILLLILWLFRILLCLEHRSKNVICFHNSKRLEILTHTIFFVPHSVFRTQVTLENEYCVVLDILPWDCCSALFTWCICTIPAR